MIMLWRIELKFIFLIIALFIRVYAIKAGNNILENIAIIIFFAGLVILCLDPFWRREI
jgi:predicted membrane protein